MAVTLGVTTPIDFFLIAEKLYSFFSLVKHYQLRYLTCFPFNRQFSLPLVLYPFVTRKYRIRNIYVGERVILKQVPSKQITNMRGHSVVLNGSGLQTHILLILRTVLQITAPLSFYCCPVKLVYSFFLVNATVFPTEFSFTACIFNEIMTSVIPLQL